MNKPIDPDKLTATPIKLPAEKAAPKLPATKSKHRWRDFDDFTALAKCLNARLRGGSREWLDWPDGGASTLAMIGEFNAAAEFFNRDDFYQRTKVAKPNLLDCHTQWQITRRVVSEQVGLLIGSFPNSVASPKVFIRMLVEEIFAANPSALALEATCRVLRRTETFGSPPTIAKVLKVLKEQAEWWDDAYEGVCVMEDQHQARQNGATTNKQESDAPPPG